MNEFIQKLASAYKFCEISIFDNLKSQMCSSVFTVYSCIHCEDI